MKINEKILLIAGASSDIGRELIRSQAGNYKTIVAHYNRSNEKLLELKKEYGDKIIPLQADFMSEDSTSSFTEEVLSLGFSPDHFVHLPALPLENVKFTKITWERFDGEISTSFRSAVLLSQAFLPHMTKIKHGKLVFMLSFKVVNQPTIKFGASYTTVKYALLGLLKALSVEYADKGITVNGVSPSMVETKFVEAVSHLLIEKNAAESPLKRNLQVGEVVPTIEFLLSQGADCVTGQNISVTGGS